MLTWRPCLLVTVIANLAASTAAAATAVEPLPPKVAAVLPDACEVLSPSAIHIDGWLGARIDANESNRLLDGRHRAASGRISQAAGQPPLDRRTHRQVDACRNARLGLLGRPAPARKLDRVAAELIACQEPDGYLGTYAPEQAVWPVCWRRMGRLVAQIQSHRSDDLLPIHGRQGGLGGLPQNGRLAHCHVSGKEKHSGGRHAHRHGRHERAGADRSALPGHRRQALFEFARYIVQVVGRAQRGQDRGQPADTKRVQDGQRQGLRDALESRGTLRGGPRDRRPPIGCRR